MMSTSSFLHIKLVQTHPEPQVACAQHQLPNERLHVQSRYAWHAQLQVETQSLNLEGTPLHVQVVVLGTVGNRRSNGRRPVERYHSVCLRNLATHDVMFVSSKFWKPVQNGFTVSSPSCASFLQIYRVGVGSEILCL